MKNRTYKAIVIILYLLSLFIFLFCLKIRFTQNVYIKTLPRIILITLACMFIYISGYILTKKLSYTKKILKMHLLIYFIVYTATICTLTLFDEIFGRQGLVLINWDKQLFKIYINNSFNLVPFKTIKLFTFGYLRGIVSFKNFSVNVFGNLCAFMPYGIFLPLLFKKMNKFSNFFWTMILIVLIIELLQFATISGSCDIDDLILNVSGASLVYLIFKIKPINKSISNFFYLE